MPKVTRIEVGAPGDFARLGKQGILEKLQERAGPEARQLFEKFMRDVAKLDLTRNSVRDIGIVEGPL